MFRACSKSNNLHFIEICPYSKIKAYCDKGSAGMQRYTD